MRLALMNWRQVEDYLEKRQTLIIPTGSTEQHGPNGLLGTDHLIADAIAQAVGEVAGVLVHPPLTIGMSQHHLAFPGSVSLTSATYMQVLMETVESLAGNGFRNFFFLNGHGGNTPPASAAASDLLTLLPGLRWTWRSWWTDPRVEALEEEIFGDRNGEHASASEVAITHFLFPGQLEPLAACEIEHPDYDWPMSPEAFRATFPDGRMMSDPSLANPEKGKRIFDLCVEIFSEEVREL